MKCPYSTWGIDEIRDVIMCRSVKERREIGMFGFYLQVSH
jgi:hypothetical protein